MTRLYAPLMACLFLATGIASAQDANSRPFDTSRVQPSVPLSLHDMTMIDAPAAQTAPAQPPAAQ
ncbi:hypothetical protein [Chromobacterium sphagni]|uniref:Uncharacterized protein n=1 Tax=Chromobacterium sphagni TaxID=1903179 RepID=A0A1S1WYN8_9NEIS|nr:hypothetical protein [Chromobacterium sphagni]OHX12240.1 hypothetical protein BI347_01035 [Chromobacterium sphagni]OHX21676.1 hypothetical protein BI344_03975 [Chromobacterium sphagni]